MENRYEMFTVLIAKINRNIRKIKNQEMAEYNLKSPHISCLYFLYLAGGLTATELCERCEEDKATISRSLDYLEKEGYLTCEVKNTKRYKSPLVLTEKGNSVARQIVAKVNRVLDDVGANLKDEEREIFYRSLNLISDNLEQVAKHNLD